MIIFYFITNTRDAIQPESLVSCVYIARDREVEGEVGWLPLPPVVIVGLCYPRIPQAPTVTAATLPQMYCKGSADQREGKSRYKEKLKVIS